VGGQRKRGGRKVKNSWVKAEFERKETEQDGKTTVAYSCLHCQRTLTGLNATRLKKHLLNPGACKFLHGHSAQEVAKQVAEVMTALQKCEEQKKEFAAWLETVRDAAEPDADGVAAVHMDVEQMEVDEEGGEQRERDEQVEGDEGVRMRMRMKRGMSDKWEKGNFYFKGDLWKGLDAANETECC